MKVVFVSKTKVDGTQVQMISEDSYKANPEAYISGGWGLATETEIKEHYPDFQFPKKKTVKKEKPEYPDEKRPGPVKS